MREGWMWQTGKERLISLYGFAEATLDKQPAEPPGVFTCLVFAHLTTQAPGHRRGQLSHEFYPHLPGSAVVPGQVPCTSLFYLFI